MNFLGSLQERRVKFSQTLLRVVVILIFFAVGFFVVKMALSGGKGTSSSQTASTTPAKAKQVINRSFKFPINNSKGEKVSDISYFIESAELRDEIFVQGKKVRPVKGKIFLVLSLKISNQQNRGIEIRTRDYVRLSYDKSLELLAPDIHNDPVEVQAISTKYTRAGFIIAEGVKNLVLQVGELDGAKEKVALQLLK